MVGNPNHSVRTLGPYDLNKFANAFDFLSSLVTAFYDDATNAKQVCKNILFSLNLKNGLFSDNCYVITKIAPIIFIFSMFSNIMSKKNATD